MKKSIFTAVAALSLVVAAGCASNPSGIKDDAERDAIRGEIMSRVNAYASDEANANCAYASEDVEQFFKDVREVRQVSDIVTLRYEYTGDDGTVYVNTFKRKGLNGAMYSQSQTRNGKTVSVVYNNGKAVVKSADGKITPVENKNVLSSLRFIFDITMKPLKMASSASIPEKEFVVYDGNENTRKTEVQKIESMVDGRFCNTVNLTLKSMYNTPSVTYYISTDDRSIIAKKYAPSKSEANDGVMIVYSDFKDEDGFYAPKKVVNTINGKSQTLVLKSVTKNFELPDEFFQIAE